MRVIPKCVRRLSLLALLLLMAGCSGIRAQKSFSILDLLLPGAGGFIQADPPPAPPDWNQPLPTETAVTRIA